MGERGRHVVQEARLEHELNGRESAHHAQVIVHEEAVDGELTGARQREAARDQAVVLHVEVGQAARVRLEFVHETERERVAQHDLAAGRAGAEEAVVDAGRRRALDEHAVGLLVADVQLTQDAAPLHVEVVDEVREAGQVESVVQVDVHALQVLERRLS